jgi:hypothetical protein
MAHDVFISYASSDKVVADAVCSQLETLHHIRCWIAPRDVTPGASWAESIIDALDESKIMVLIFSSNANASMQIEREVERAVHKGINIIPLRIENAMPTKTLEYFISAPHWLDAMSVPLESHISKLAASVKALLARHAVPTPPRAVDPAGPAVPLPTPQVASRPAAPAAPPPVTSTESHPAAPAAVIAAADAPRPGSKLVPKLLMALVAAAVIVFGIRAGLPAPQITTPAPASVAAPVDAAPAPAPAVRAPAPGAPVPAAVPAAAAPAVVKLEPNVFIDLPDNLSEGTLTLEVDGQKRWTQKIAGDVKSGTDTKSKVDVKGKADAKGGELNLTDGPHKVTVTLLNPQGKVKETKSTSLSIVPGMPLTLRVRLSRFKKDLELQAVARKTPLATAAASKPGAVSNDKTKAVAPKPVAGKS